MARKMTEWPSKRGPITKIMPSDGCIGDTVPSAVGKWYDFHEFGWYMGNVGQEFPHQPNCRPSVPAGLNQEIQDFALTVHGTPEIELPPSNYDDHLVQVPAFGRSWPPTLNPPRISEAAERERHSEQSAPQETHEESQRRAQRDAREFSRLQSAAYNATGEERKAAQKEFDDYVERHSKTRETAEEEERQTHKRSRGRSMGM